MNQRNLFFSPLIIILSLFVLTISCNSQQTPAPSGLLCQLLRDPNDAVITDSLPEFSWIVNSQQNDVRQTAYRLLVASSQENIDKNQGNIWDSGKISSDRSSSVSYQGIPLSAQNNYWWKVKTWDSKGEESDFSAAQAFHTGKFINRHDDWPGESHWVQLTNGDWVLENRQRATFQDIAPKEIIENPAGNYFVDFGKAAFATLEMNLQDPSNGDSLTIYLGERKNDDFTVNKNPGVSNIGYARVVVGLDKNTHTYLIELPRHIAHYPHSQQLPDFMPEVMPYRFVEIIGLKEDLNEDKIKQHALLYYFNDNASAFNSSDSLLNSVWGLCKYTLKATPFLSLYADGNRERMPYEADAYIQQMGNYCVDREFSLARYTLDFLLYNASWPTEWQMHTVIMAWQDYMHTADPEFLAKHYDELKNKTLIALAGDDGLISTRTGLVDDAFLKSIHLGGHRMEDIVDWPQGTPKGKRQARNAGPTPEGERDGYVFTDYNTVVNAFHYHSLVLISKIAAVLNKKEDQQFFEKRAALVKQSINDKFFDSTRGIYVDGEGTNHASLHANMFPLAFGLVPQDKIAGVVKFIESRGMACSVYGAEYLLDGLYDAGDADYALRLMTSDSKRSWLNMLRVGSTMTTEAWDEYYKPNLTWNHAWGSAPANIIPRKLMGIEPIEPGFSRFQIKPQPGTLQEASLKMPTIKGLIDIHLKKDTQQFLLDVTIPANTVAELYWPVEYETKILVNNQNIESMSTIKKLHENQEWMVLEVPSGDYHFSGSK